MKQFVLLTAAILSLACISSGTPCSSGTLADYIALAPAGCTIANHTLSGFATLSGISGATPIAPDAVTLSPSGGVYDPALMASVDLTAGTRVLLEALFTYRISGSIYTGDSITLSGSSKSADGAVTDIQNVCAGGFFDPGEVTGCTGVPIVLLTLDGVLNQNLTSLTPVSFISVIDDFTLDGGLAGSASAGSITDRFAAVPEPLTGSFIAFGFALFLGFRLRSLSVRSIRKGTL